MARGRHTRSFTRRRRAVYWDQQSVAQANLPGAIVISDAAAIDGTITGIRRYENSNDRTIVRTILDFIVTIRQSDFQVSSDAVLELCVGIGIQDSNNSLNGQAINQQLAVGSGPLSDAENSKWMVRCCVLIPIGQMVQAGSAENMIYKPTADSYVIMQGGTSATGAITWGCHVDTKVMRKLHGLETPWINVAMEGQVQPTPSVGDNVNINMNGFSVRWLLQNAA